MALTGAIWEANGIAMSAAACAYAEGLARFAEAAVADYSTDQMLYGYRLQYQHEIYGTCERCSPDLFDGFT